MSVPEITRSEVERFMSWELTEGMDLYDRIVDDIVADPEGQVAQWCDEIRQYRQSRMDDIFTSTMSLGPYDSGIELDSVTNVEGTHKGIHSPRAPVSLFCLAICWLCGGVLVAGFVFEVFIYNASLETVSRWAIEATITSFLIGIGVAILGFSRNMVRWLKSREESHPRFGTGVLGVCIGIASSIPLLVPIIWTFAESEEIHLWMIIGFCGWCGGYFGLTWGSHFTQSFWSTSPTWSKWIVNCLIVLASWLPLIAFRLAETLTSQPYGVATAQYYVWSQIAVAFIGIMAILPGIALLYPLDERSLCTKLVTRAICMAVPGVLVGAWIAAASTYSTTGWIVGLAWFLTITSSAVTLSLPSEAIASLFFREGTSLRRISSLGMYILCSLFISYLWWNDLSDAPANEGRWLPFPSVRIAREAVITFFVFSLWQAAKGWFYFFSSGSRNWQIPKASLFIFLPLLFCGCGSWTDAIKADLRENLSDIEALKQDLTLLDVDVARLKASLASFRIEIQEGEDANGISNGPIELLLRQLQSDSLKPLANCVTSIDGLLLTNKRMISACNTNMNAQSISTSIREVSGKHRSATKWAVIDEKMLRNEDTLDSLQDELSRCLTVYGKVSQKLVQDLNDLRLISNRMREIEVQRSGKPGTSGIMHSIVVDCEGVINRLNVEDKRFKDIHERSIWMIKLRRDEDRPSTSPSAIKRRAVVDLLHQKLKRLGGNANGSVDKQE